MICTILIIVFSFKVFAQNCGHNCGAYINKNPEAFEVRHSINILNKDYNKLATLHSVSASKKIRKNLYFGQSLYSAVSGDVGGLFIGGFELSKRFQIRTDQTFELGVFLGGGGGAALVAGDGMMEKYYVNINQELNNGYSSSIGFSYLNITGSDVTSGTLNFGISKTQNYATVLGHGKETISSGRFLVSAKPIIKQFWPGSSLKRDGTRLKKMNLMGIEATFASSTYALNESFVQTTGAVEGDGEGYADIQFGYRQHLSKASLKGFWEISTGFGGGGDVDTGGGLLGSFGIGASLPIFYNNKIELGIQKISSLDGELNALSPFLRTAIIFNKRKKAYHTKRRWQLSFGVTKQLANEKLRKPGIEQGNSVSLIENSVDLFITDNIYLIGNAQTVISGNAGGYAVGLLGLGYTKPINNSFSYSFEIYSGAAGGGGIDTKGGMSKAMRLEVDYNLKDNLALTLGAGRLSAQNSKNGFNSMTTHIGLKTKFTTFH
ncbi:hypothetical protein N9R41_00315 [bacterium]|nr:hypothetical protein [bacterium]